MSGLTARHGRDDRGGGLGQTVMCGYEARQEETTMMAFAPTSLTSRQPPQTASEHCLRLCGMKPTVLDQRNLSDLHTLALWP